MALSRKKLLAASALVVGLGLTTACSSDDNPNSPDSVTPAIPTRRASPRCHQARRPRAAPRKQLQ